LDPSWVKIYPYQSVVEQGGRQALQIRVQNYKPSPMKIEVSLVAPAEWSIEPDALRLEAPAQHNNGDVPRVDSEKLDAAFSALRHRGGRGAGPQVSRADCRGGGRQT
jgi:hypothetical protein